MTTVGLTLAALPLSVAAIFYLQLTDPKRRRVFSLGEARFPRHAFAGWAVVILPGVMLAFSANAPAFIIWFAALTVIGWLIAQKHEQPRAVGAGKR